MRPKHLDYEILNDDVSWADPHMCSPLLHTGIWFLYEILTDLRPGCELLEWIIRLGDEFERAYKEAGSDPSKLSQSQMAKIWAEMNILGTLGHSLWHLRSYVESPGLRQEIDELSKIGCGENATGDVLRLRGQGFLMLSAAQLAKQGFELEFIVPRKNPEKPGEKLKTPDFFAKRDGNRFCCEATSCYPQQGQFGRPAYFWRKINEVVDRKRPQFGLPEYQKDCVLIIDCTPVLDAVDLLQMPCTDTLVYSIPPSLGGPRSGSAPIIRYDGSAFCTGLQNLEEAIRGTAIHTLILWKHACEVVDNAPRRSISYRAIGSVEGVLFLSYFEKALVFPGPNVQLVYS